MGFSRKKSASLIALLTGSIVMGGYRYQAESIDVDQDGDVDMNDLFKIFSVIFFSGYGLFHTVLPGPTFTGVYTIYPHPNHTSLRSLMFRLNEMARWGGNIPEHLFITKGIHDEGGDCVQAIIKHLCNLKRQTIKTYPKKDQHLVNILNLLNLHNLLNRQAVNRKNGCHPNHILA